MTYGVSQGSILGPLLFKLYMLLLLEFSRNVVLLIHSYGDDTQIYLKLSMNDCGSIDLCLKNVKNWLQQYFLQLNKDKMEIILRK